MSTMRRTGFTDPESGSTAYSYDALNRLTSLAPPSAFGSGSFGFSYDALSRRTQMTRPNSVTTNYAYDNLSRLTSVLHQLSGSTIDGASYTLDSAGNRTAKTDHLASGTSNYTYDAIYQLTQVTQANNTTESFSYDAVGNRTASLGVSSYTTNASNELTATSNASYTYDSNGNTLTKTVGSDTTTYAWDFENRLTSVTLPGSGGTVSFKYDPFGRRIEKSSSATTSVFAYDGDDLIEEANSSGGVVARYTHTQNIDEPLAVLRSSVTSYYNADGLGSITSLSNSSGATAETYKYDSFGKVTASSGSLVNPFQYTGRELDVETGLYYYRARYYDTDTGRFLSEDPIRFSGGGNFFRYVSNSPLNGTDPSGLWSTPAHHQIFWNALKPCGVSNADIWQIQQGSDFADSIPFQGAEWSFMHSMSNGTTFQSPQDAKNQTAQFVSSELSDATSVFHAGGNDQAMFLFGLAMHPVTDQSSSAHTDENGNPIPWCGLNPFGCSRFGLHGDAPLSSIENLKHLNADPSVQQRENLIIRKAFEGVTGKKLNCNCSQ